MLTWGPSCQKPAKSSAFWDMGVNSNLKWLSPDEAGESVSTSLCWCGGTQRPYIIETMLSYTLPM